MRRAFAGFGRIPERLFATSTRDKAMRQIALDRKSRPFGILACLFIMIGGGLAMPGAHLVPPSLVALLAMTLSHHAGRAYERSPSPWRMTVVILLCLTEACCVAIVVWCLAVHGALSGVILAMTIFHLWTQAAYNARSIDMRFFFAMIIPVIGGLAAAIPAIDEAILPPETHIVCYAVFLLMAIVSLATGWISHNLYEDLLITRDRATEAVAIKERVLATVSHEIRTLLNGIMGVGQMMLTAGGTSEKARASTILSSGKAMKSLLDDLLDHAKIQSGQFVVRYVAMEPDPILRQVVALFRDAAAAKGVTVELSVDPDLPLAILGDPARFRQILSNLISNAVKHTSEGHIAVTALAEDGDRILVKVRDTGRGIADADLDRLFEPFGQLDDAAAHSGAGTGLGLAVSREMARLMKGDLSVASCPGEGSTFALELPAAPAEVSRSGRAARSTNLAGLTALLVDDIKINRVIARSFLEQANMEVIEATDGAAALETLKSEAVDIVITDLHMPTMGGEALLRAIRAEPDLPHLPVVLLSAGHATSIEEFDATLTKPVDCGELQAAIGRIMQPS